jgi:hypothetical protein
MSMDEYLTHAHTTPLSADDVVSIMVGDLQRIRDVCREEDFRFIRTFPTRCGRRIKSSWQLDMTDIWSAC